MVEGSALKSRVRPQRRTWLWAVAVFLIGEAIQLGGVANHHVARALFSVAALLIFWDLYSRLKSRPVPLPAKKVALALVCVGAALIVITGAAWKYLAPLPSDVTVVDRIISQVELLFKKYAGLREPAPPIQSSLKTLPQSIPPGVSVPSIGLAPYAVIEHVRYRQGGEDVGGTHYGLGAILRVMNTTATAIQIRQLEIIGDVQADSNDYLMAFGKDGSSFEALDAEYGRVKPYRTLSWVVYPIDEGYVREREEKFVRFIIADPEKHQGRIYGGEARDYFGSVQSNTKPKILTRNPYLWDLITFTSNAPAPFPPGSQEFRGPRFKKEVSSGDVKFRLRTNSGLFQIGPTSIQPIRLIDDKGFIEEVVQELFWGGSMYDRAAPASKDPAMR